VVKVQVPPDATASAMKEWAKQIEAWQKVAGKDLMINFFNSSDTRTSNMVAYYSSGVFTATTESDRQKLRQEGD
jgi:hypothetical protein